MKFNVVGVSSADSVSPSSRIGFYLLPLFLALLTLLSSGCGDDAPQTHPDTTTAADSAAAGATSTTGVGEDSTNATLQTPLPDSTAIRDSIANAKHRKDSIKTALQKREDSIKAAGTNGDNGGQNGTAAGTTASKGEGCSEVTDDLIRQGQAIFTQKGNCSNCHGGEGKGTKLGPDLTDNKWLHISGDYPSIMKLVRSGVDMVVEYPTPMPPMGGARLSDAEICAVAAYVWSFRH